MGTHTFLTGDIRIGKSTIIKAVIDSLSLKNTAGLFTRWANRNNAAGAGLYMFFADLKTIDLLWDINKMDDPDSVPEIKDYMQENNLIAYFDSGNYKKKIVNKSVFDELGFDYLDKTSSADLIIIDEIGIFEDKSYDFRDKLKELLEGSTPILGTVRSKSGILTDMIKTHPNVDLIEVTKENRDDIKKRLVKKFKSQLSK